MLRRSLAHLAEVVKSISTTQSGKGPAKKKKVWKPRHPVKVRHNGKDVFGDFGYQPSCELCHVRFRYKQDYQAHKESELHKARVRWTEMTTWYYKEAVPLLTKVENNSWEWYKKNVIVPKSKATGESFETLSRAARRSRLLPRTGVRFRMTDYPQVKVPIVEPRDLRWPGSPKL